jgi:hypothetical protein
MIISLLLGYLYNAQLAAEAHTPRNPTPTLAHPLLFARTHPLDWIQYSEYLQKPHRFVAFLSVATIAASLMI